MQLAAKSPSQNDNTLLTPPKPHLQALVISAARIVANSVGQQTLSFKGQALGWFILIMHGVTIVRLLSLSGPAIVCGALRDELQHVRTSGRRDDCLCFALDGACVW